MRKLESVLDLIGNTPAKRLDSIGQPFHVSLWAKLENLNPSGSIKDRIALQMIEDAEKSGGLKKWFTIIESSSASNGIGIPSAKALVLTPPPARTNWL